MQLHAAAPRGLAGLCHLPGPSRGFPQRVTAPQGGPRLPAPGAKAAHRSGAHLSHVFLLAGDEYDICALLGKSNTNGLANALCARTRRWLVTSEAGCKAQQCGFAKQGCGLRLGPRTESSNIWRGSRALLHAAHHSALGTEFRRTLQRPCWSPRVMRQVMSIMGELQNAGAHSHTAPEPGNAFYTHLAPVISTVWPLSRPSVTISPCASAQDSLCAEGVEAWIGSQAQCHEPHLARACANSASEILTLI